jgi:hypothetical protein
MRGKSVLSCWLFFFCRRIGGEISESVIFYCAIFHSSISQLIGCLIDE